jgi:nicotinamide riboside transporter PnuC
MLTHILKYPISFHIWKLAAGFVLSVLATIFLFLLFTEPLGEEPLGYTMVAMTVTLCIGAIMFLHRSILPYGGSVFLWPYVPQKSRNDWRIARHPLKLLDVIFMLSATTTVVTLLLDMLPRASHWQGTAFVISMSAMFMMTVILYGARFLPEKPWIDTTVTISGGVIALITCIILGLQPM